MLALFLLSLVFYRLLNIQLYVLVVFSIILVYDIMFSIVCQFSYFIVFVIFSMMMYCQTTKCASVVAQRLEAW